MIMQETFKYHQASIFTSGRHISNLVFADDIDLMVGKNTPRSHLTNRLNSRAGAYGKEVSVMK
ncbi:hypothetical protein DPMN_026985 [Dreissena polymorpha]|uniref:Uncharacterized protein n=1 Tax=Dreissena polymorpha TaxID=45954 RepID=A0A9D4LS30_DREPO|nr:hypothetical protein DPMN_026985 [Dreissena polymorpha]